MNHEQDDRIDYRRTGSVLVDHSTAASAREKPEPESGNEPLTLWAFLLGTFFILVGGGYLGANHGGFDMANFTRTPYVPGERPDTGDEPEAIPMDKMWIGGGKSKYAQCAGCHQANGQGNAQYPPLAGSEWVVRGTEPLAMIILNGLIGPITVNGKNYNAPGMKNWESDFSDADIAQIMSYIRTAWGNDELVKANGDPDGIVTEEMVAAAREKHAAKPDNHKVEDFAGLEDSMLPGEKPDWAPSKQAEGGAE